MPHPTPTSGQMATAFFAARGVVLSDDDAIGCDLACGVRAERERLDAIPIPDQVVDLYIAARRAHRDLGAAALARLDAPSARVMVRYLVRLEMEAWITFDGDSVDLVRRMWLYYVEKARDPDIMLRCAAGTLAELRAELVALGAADEEGGGR